MKRSLLITFAAALASALVLTPAFAGSSYADSPSDATGNAPEITAVRVSNDNGGQILFQVSVADLTPESVVAVPIDIDKNAATGDDGNEYWLRLSSSATPSYDGWTAGRWDGSEWVHPDSHPTVWVVQTPTGVEFSINASELGGTTGFAFSVESRRWVADAIVGVDSAPDGLAKWIYDLTKPIPPSVPAPTVVKPVFGKATMVPPRVAAGKKVVFTLAVSRSDTGAPLTTGKMICHPYYMGIMIKHAESFKGGTAKLAFTVPKAAKGKTLKVKITIVNGKQSATRIMAYKVA